MFPVDCSYSLANVSPDLLYSTRLDCGVLLVQYKLGDTEFSAFKL